MKSWIIYDMRNIFRLFIIITICVSCEDGDQETLNEKFIFNYNLHESLPDEWVSEFYTIIGNLENLIPATPRSYQDNMNIYSWVSNIDKPFKKHIGNTTGACICGNDKERYMVLEIPENEFKYNQLHRFSVIAHEYFHVYQMSLSESFFDGDIELKWLSEGTAASFESIYIQQFYGENYFLEAQSQVDVSAVNNPTIFEKFDLSSDKDTNYSSSVFIALALTKELQKNGKTEEEAFRLIYKDYWELNPSDDNWKQKFEELFTFSVENFYDRLSQYSNEISTVLPSEKLRIQDIFI
ncbi:MAG: hypothetical protein CNE34_05470 [Rhodothermaeota bacterium MED-G18]|nr:MAG: hypothetical protein CNE34_05470 [Rhodothermaeota bacterium MED-G18]|tara:strand:+ start:760 stop:1644 length:885 start_codon:yes stop_codon:yes gene_type:complete